jgi:hypothetical protein
MLHIHLGTEYDKAGKIVAVRYFTTPAVGAQWVKVGPHFTEGKGKFALRFVSTTAIPVCETVEEAALP